MTILTYLDSSVVIAIAEGEPDVADAAIEALDDPSRVIALSEAVRLEVMPERLRNQRKKDQIPVVDALFAKAAVVVSDFGPSIWKKAEEEATRHGMQAMDALHVAAAIEAGADELLTAERETKPMCMTSSLRVRSLRPGRP